MFHFWCPVPVEVRTNEQTYRETCQPSGVSDVSIVNATQGDNEPVVEAEARLQRLQPATITTALNSRHNAKVAKYDLAYHAVGHKF